MKNRTMLTLGLAGLILGGAAIGTTLTQAGIAIANDLAARNLKQAAADAAQAQAALAHGKIAKAVKFAESAVRFSPQDASYRALLGNAYIKAGRFASARDALSDSLALSPDDAPIALSLALAQTATGDWVSARKTLEDHAAIIPVADRGLAMALAGDPEGAVDLLTEAARGPSSDPKTRQNLALALALAGRWEDAKAVAAVDVNPGELDQRMAQWAAFARPKAASDQVASLLGVSAIEDRGQPVALALNAQVPNQAPIQAPIQSMAAVDATAPAAADAPVAITVAAAAVEDVTMPASTPAAVATAQPVRRTIIFGERKAVVQALPANYVAQAARVKSSPTRPAMVARQARVAGNSPTARYAAGSYYVQLGAFDSAGVAQNGWTRAVRRLPSLADHSPSGAPLKTATGTIYRLSVGGFARADAASLCIAYRAQGGRCFVRSGAGDRVASWVKPPRQLALR